MKIRQIFSKRVWMLLVLVFLASIACTKKTEEASKTSTLDIVKERGVLKCGVSQGLTGFSDPDDQGDWTGIDVDYCRAVAAAIFNDPTKVEFVSLSAKVRFTSLTSGEVDILSRNTTWTLSRDTGLGIDFVGVTYYDGQGFLVKKSSGITSALDMDGVSVCSNTGTTTELNASDFFKKNKLKYELIAFENSNEVIAAYDAERCDVYTTDRSGVAAERLKLKDPEAHIVLPEIISKEPLGPAVRQGDDQWANVARWVLNALITAEELGITKDNVEDTLNSEVSPEVSRFLAKKPTGFGKMLGLEDQWAYRIIKHIGNYGEMYERNVGPNTPLKLERGVNALWNNGGILYAPPIR